MASTWHLKLLSEGRHIAGVALDTGFFDQSHFTHSFKRLMGITPGDYFRTAADKNTGVFCHALESENDHQRI